MKSLVSLSIVSVAIFLYIIMIFIMISAGTGSINTDFSQMIRQHTLDITCLAGVILLFGIACVFEDKANSMENTLSKI